MITVTEKIRFFTCGVSLDIHRSFDVDAAVQSARFVVKDDVTDATEVAAIDVVGSILDNGSSGMADVLFQLTAAQTLLLASEKQFYVTVTLVGGAVFEPIVGVIHGDEGTINLPTGVVQYATAALPTDMTRDWDAALGAGAGGSLQERIAGQHALVVAGSPVFRTTTPPLLMFDGNDGLEVANVPVPQGDYTMMGVARIDADASISSMQLWGWLAVNPSPGVGSSSIRDFIGRTAMTDLSVTVADMPVSTGFPLVQGSKGGALTPYYVTVARRVTADYIDLFVQGRLVASQGRGDSTIDKRRGATGTFGFGKQPGSNALFMIGGIGRLFIVDGRAMTSTEIEAAHMKLRETYTRLPLPGSLATPNPVPTTNLTNDWSPAASQFTDRVGSAHAVYDGGAGAPTLQSTWPPIALFSGAQGASVAGISMSVPLSGIAVVRLDSLALNAAVMHIMGMAPVGTDSATYYKRLSIMSDAINGALIARAQATPMVLTTAAESSIKNGGVFPAYFTIGWSIDTNLMMRLYVNGVMRGSADLGAIGDFPNEPATGTYTFGRSPTNTEYFLGGGIGRSLRWSRVLNDDEFAITHNALREQYEKLPLV